MNIGVILAAGDSKKFGGYINKQYLKINGKEMLFYTIKKFRDIKLFDKIILVVDEKEYTDKYIQNKYKIECIKGGSTRNKSIQNAIEYVEKNYKNCKNILFHDSVRPGTKIELFKDSLLALNKYDAVAVVDDIRDGLISDNVLNIKRDKIKIVQTPEAFKFEVLKDNFKSYKNNLSIISQIKSENIKFLKSDIFNFKVVYPADLFMIENIMDLDYYNVSKKQFNINKLSDVKNILILGGSGGIGGCLKEFFLKNKKNVYSPKRDELDLNNITKKSFKNYLANKQIDCIINASAIYYDDQDGLVEKFDEIFNVNVKSNLIIVETLKELKISCNIILFSSSSSTKGRENLTNYSASKAALNSIIQSQAPELIKYNIYLNGIIPEKVNTPLIQKLHKTDINLRELLDINQIIYPILELCITKQTGKLIHIRKGF